MPVIEIKVPVIAESVTEVTLSQWLKPNGSLVKLDEAICEFESDKATLELPAEVAGKLTWGAKAGQDLKIGEVLATIDTDAAGATVAPAAAAPTAQPAAAAKVETPTVTAPNTNYATGFPSPAANKILADNGTNAANVSGTGKDGRITKEDALKAVAAQGVTASPSPPEGGELPSKIGNNVQNSPPSGGLGGAITPAIPSGAAIAFSRNSHREKMSRMRQTIAKRLVSAKNTTAMLTTFNEVDMTEVMALREKVQEKFVKKYGIKLGFMSIFAKACAKTLLEMPEVNAQIDGNELIFHDYADISFAISTPTGLVVPPIMNCESLKFSEIEIQLKALAEKARNGKLTVQEMQGGTFTITNGGTFGSMMSTPIINEPQSAILGMHNIVQRPMVVGGEIKIRPMMYVALSYDHRVIDGSSSVTFLVKVKQLLEDPTLLLMDL